MKRAVHVVLLALLALAVIGNAALAAELVLAIEPPPKTLSPERVATASKPAIVFIESDYTISVSIPRQTFTDATRRALQEQLQPLVNSGQITTQAQWDHVWYQTIINNPDAYFTAGATYSDTWYDAVSGSGFFVTEDGYMVTAAHVVTASKSGERAGIVAATKDPVWVAGDKKVIEKAFAAYGPSDAEVSKLVDFDQRWVAKYLSVDKIDASYHVGSGDEVSAGDQITKSGIRASVVSIDPQGTGHDIAVMKADVAKVSALPLATGDPKMGDATYAIGYPFTASMARSEAASTTFSVTVTVGKIQRMNSETSSSGSWRVYGTDAQLEHGDSGGPVVDANGRVMGVMSFIVPDANGDQLPGQGYFVPSSFVREDLANANVSLASDPNNLTNTYYRALAQGDESRFKVELNLLNNVHDRASMDAYVDGDIRHAQNELRAGNDRTPPNLDRYVLPALGSAGGVVLLTLLSWLVLGIVAGRKPRSTPPDTAREPPPEPNPAFTVPAD